MQTIKNKENRDCAKMPMKNVQNSTIQALAVVRRPVVFVCFCLGFLFYCVLILITDYKRPKQQNHKWWKYSNKRGIHTHIGTRIAREEKENKRRASTNDCKQRKEQIKRKKTVKIRCSGYLPVSRDKVYTGCGKLPQTEQNNMCNS